MTEADVGDVVELAARTVGEGYYAADEVHAMLERCDGHAYVAREDEALLGFRFTLPPGRWEQGRGQGLHPERWGAPLSRAAYFQSCFVAPDRTGEGVGRRLAQMALEGLKTTGAEVVVAHSWKESPHGSSRRYLDRLGFRVVAEVRDYWAEVDYRCSRCGAPPCRCTALEMVRTLGPSP